jgi:hypothetical protein
MRGPVELLTRRIAELDGVTPLLAQPRPVALAIEDPELYTLLWQFADVMSRHTHTLMEHETEGRAIIDPLRADEMVAGSRLVTAISEYEPGLTSGPLQRDRQHWTAIAGREDLPHTPVEPAEDLFVVPSVGPDQECGIKPFDVGLYTSTSTTAGCSMWRVLISEDSGALHPRPWYTWKLEVNAKAVKVAEIASAQRWVHFISTYPWVHNGLVYPHWVKAAEDFDAVHIMLPTIAAAQGFHFRASGGVIPPAFWDVESTFWLRWRFSGARLVETCIS